MIEREIDRPTVTLHVIARTRQFVRVAALYLRILLLEIIKYAAIMITNKIVDLRGCWRKNSRSVRRAARFLPVLRYFIGKRVRHCGSPKIGACGAFRLSNKVPETRPNYQIRHTLSN
jgi:hypothetical protein